MHLYDNLCVWQYYEICCTVRSRVCCWFLLLLPIYRCIEHKLFVSLFLCVQNQVCHMHIKFISFLIQHMQYIEIVEFNIYSLLVIHTFFDVDKAVNKTLFHQDFFFRLPPKAQEYIEIKFNIQ